MPVEITKLAREFTFNGMKLPDPNPNFSVEQVREIYVGTHPDLATATVEGPDAKGDKLVYRFIRAVGAKG